MDAGGVAGLRVGVVDEEVGVHERLLSIGVDGTRAILDLSRRSYIGRTVPVPGVGALGERRRGLTRLRAGRACSASPRDAGSAQTSSARDWNSRGSTAIGRSVG